MRALAIIFFSGALSCLVAGCGDDSKGAGDQDQFISQVCAEYADCCEAAGRPSDGAQCRAFYGAFAPSSGYDQVAAQACLDEIRAVPDKCASGGLSTPSCDKVFAGSSGTGKPGDPCEDNRDCAPSDEGEVECVGHFSDGAMVRQCEERLHGEEGSAPCLGTVEGNVTSYSGGSGEPVSSGYLCHVAEGLACDYESGACKKLPALGEACASGFYQCPPEAYCAFPENTCQARLALGEACEQDEECKENAYCEPNGSTCAAQRAVGEACTANAQCESAACTNGKCEASNDFTLALLCGSN
jgi:hypothetical protein